MSKKLSQGAMALRGGLAIAMAVAAAMSLGCPGPTPPGAPPPGPPAPKTTSAKSVTTDAASPKAAESESPRTKSDDTETKAAEAADKALEEHEAKKAAEAGDSDKGAEGPTPETKAQPAQETSVPAKPTSEQKVAATDVAGPKYHGPVDAHGNPQLPSGNWNQWGGSPMRNAVVHAVSESQIPTDFAVGDFDRKTGKWKKDSAKNVEFVANLGSQTYGNPVVGDGKIFVGTNNTAGYLKRYPAEVDLGCMIAFNEADGEFLWQDSSEKLPTGRVHDWPLMGICCSAIVEGDRVWYVTSRGEVKCLDTEGFRDGEDDGPLKGERGRLFDIMKNEDPIKDQVAPAVTELDAAKWPEKLDPLMAKAGFALTEPAVEVKDAGKAWVVKGKVDGKDREVRIMLAGTRFQVFKVITPDDLDEADTVWTLDMMKTMGTSQHNMCSCSITTWGDFLYVNSSNGVHEDHKTIPSPEAPSFICMNKHTGEIYWTDNSPGGNILHGQWSSPTCAVIDGVPQVLFGGGDAWLYSYKIGAEKELLWQFDANPKMALLELGGRGTRNDIISTPIVYDGLVYFATGQDPEHGEGIGIFWCIDPTKRGDISEELAVKRDDPTKAIPHKRVQAVVESNGEVAVPNPNSGVVWKLDNQEVPLKEDEKDQAEFRNQFHRSIGTPAADKGMVFVADFSGLFWCIDAKTGKVNWNYDMLAASWGSPLILGDKVFVGDEDGDIVIFEVSAEQHDPIAELNMGNSVYTSPIFANGKLIICNKDHLFSISASQN